MDRATVLEILSRNRAEAEQRFNVNSLAIFGSMARDEAGPESDIDILVEFRDTPGLSEFVALKVWLEEHLGRRVDLVMRSALEEWARPIVESESVPVA